VFYSQELYSEWTLNDRELAEVRLFGNPLYAIERSIKKTALQESYIFASNAWSSFFIANLVVNGILYCNMPLLNLKEGYIAKLWDVSVLVCCGLFILSVVWVMYPYYT